MLFSDQYVGWQRLGVADGCLRATTRHRVGCHGPTGAVIGGKSLTGEARLFALLIPMSRGFN